MSQRFLKKDSLKSFVDALAADYSLYYIRKGTEGRLHLVEYRGELKGCVIGEVRPFEPLKNFFFCARERVVDGYDDSRQVKEADRKPFCILGAKNCDLKGLDILDYVFAQGEFKDPFYIRNRRNNLIIAADCTKSIETCFCLALGHKTYPEKNYDITVSELREGYVIEAATDKGERFLGKNEGLFGKVSQHHIDERDRIRKRTAEEVALNIRNNEIPNYTEYADIIKANLDSDIWQHEIEKCVECGCCNVICPTCHCFYLIDTAEDDKSEVRFKVWDSCMYKRFARVAGGANPRAHLWERLRNRFEKKFDYFPQVSGLFACTGCGRCYSGCPAKIDIRRILKELVAEKKTKKVKSV